MNHAASAFTGNESRNFADRNGHEAHCAPMRTHSPVTASVVHLLCQTRKERSKFLPDKVFGEPGWDVLLQLYAAHLDGQRISIRTLTKRTGIAATTVLRWTANLADDGLVTRSEDPTDLRRVFVALSFAGVAALDRYFTDTGTRAILI